MSTGHGGKKLLFPFGVLLMTAGVNSLLLSQPLDSGRDPLKQLLVRHGTGDWGDLDADDKALNDAAVTHGDRLMSAYTLFGRKVWLITEADRSATTLLFPEDY